MKAAVIWGRNVLFPVFISSDSELSLQEDGFDVFLINFFLVHHFFLVLNFDLLIRTLLIDLNNMGLSFFHQLISHILSVSFFGILLDSVTNLRIFWKQVVDQIFLAESDGFNILNANIYELRLLVVAHVVITNVAIASDFDVKVILLL